MTEESKHFYDFGGDFRLDAREKILYSTGVAVPLKPKAVEMLIVLVENAGSVVCKKDLMNAVWQEVFVEENNLSVNIYELRKAFAKIDKSNKFIETVSRRGFRFSAPVEKICAVENSSAQNESGEKVNNENLEKIDGEYFETDTLPKLAATQSKETDLNQTSAAFENRKTVARASFGRRNFAAAFMIICLVILGGGSFYAWRAGAVQRVKPDANDSARQIRRSEQVRGTDSTEAYQYYLRGRELWQTRSNPQMEKGIEFFRRAIELDPNFAAPYSGIADSLSMMRNDAEDWRQAEEYARKAIALAPDSADARASLAFIL